MAFPRKSHGAVAGLYVKDNHVAGFGEKTLHARQVMPLHYRLFRLCLCFRKPPPDRVFMPRKETGFVVGYELAALRLWYLLQLFYCVLHDYPCQKVFNHGYGFFHAAYGFRFGGCGVLVNHFKLAVRKSHCATSCGCFIIAPVHAFSAGSVRPSKSARCFP